MSDIHLRYDVGKRRAVITFPNGRQLALANVSEEKARKFAREHGPEFERRDCILYTGETHSRQGGLLVKRGKA